MDTTRTIVTGRLPVFADPGHTSIFLLATFQEIPEHGEVMFHAHPNDPHSHGQEIFARAMAGEFGTVQAYIGPPPEAAVGILQMRT